MDQVDPIEVQIVASAMARGTCYWLPLMRYQIQRDAARAQREWYEYVARLTDMNGAEHG